MNRMTLEVTFTAVDSLYFRGTRPYAAAAGASIFPPSPGTFAGAVRARLGDALGLDWNAFNRGICRHSRSLPDGLDPAELMGTADDTGLLEFGAPVIRKGGEPLYPMPSVLLRSDRGLVKMELGPAVRTDLGYIRLPVLPEGGSGARPLDNCWLTAAGMQQFLEGGIPDATHIVEKPDLVRHEPRLGIARNQSVGTVIPGMLFQTDHLRLAEDVDFAIRVTLPAAAAELLQEDIANNPLQRFGGEGRMAALTAAVVDPAEALPVPGDSPSLLVLLTDMLPGPGAANTPLPGFQATSVDGVDCWVGATDGIEFYVLSVASGKPRRVGGWDIRNNRPRPVQSYVPAGSCFFVRPVHEPVQLKQLHGRQIGQRTDFGFGTLLCAS